MDKLIAQLLCGYDNFILVIANGELPQHQAIVEFISKRNKLIIACDGAISQIAQKNIVVDYVIGDGDSVPSLKKENVKNPYIHDPDQNTNDLSKAINFIKKNFGYNQQIVIIGANGKREDHAIANVALLNQYSAYFPDIIMLSDYGIFNVSKPGSTCFTTIPGEQISIFCLEPDNLVSCPELKWPLTNFTLPYLNSGTLNQATKNQINISTTRPLLLYRAFEVKP